VAVRASIQETFLEHLKRHEIEEERISETAIELGVTLETGVRLERIMSEFYSLLPRIVQWYAERILKKHEGHPQMAYVQAVKIFNRLGVAVFLQALSFFVFLVVGFLYAAAV
jgi:hypothetical protein